MMARGTLLSMALLLGLCAGTAVAQPDKGEVTPEQIQSLRQQLAALAALQGMTPEQVQELARKFQKNNPNGLPPNWQDLLNPMGPNLPLPNAAPPMPPRGPGPQPLPLDAPEVMPQAGGQNPLEPRRPFPNGFNPDRPGANPFQPPPLDPKFNGNPNAAEMAKAWEKNFGPLDRTPAVRDMLLELFAQGQDGGFGNGDWKDLLDEFNKNGNGNNEGFGDWMKEMNFENGEKWDWGDWGGGKGWEWPKWGGNDWGGGRNNGGGGGGRGGGWGWGDWGGGGGGSGGGGGTWLPVILLVVIAVGALLAWKFWPMLANRESAAAAGVRALNRWPVDPRTIRNREELVKAFEYLSVLLCGDAARVWNHETIARALRQQIPHSEMVADELAKLYELARYTPPGEQLSPSALADARRCLCHLAGVNA